MAVGVAWVEPLALVEEPGLDDRLRPVGLACLPEVASERLDLRESHRRGLRLDARQRVLAEPDRHLRPVGQPLAGVVGQGTGLRRFVGKPAIEEPLQSVGEQRSIERGAGGFGAPR